MTVLKMTSSLKPENNGVIPTGLWKSLLMSHFSSKNYSHLLPTGSSSIGVTKDQILVSNGRVCLSSNISRQNFLCQNGAFDMARPSLTKSFSSLTLYFNPRAFYPLSALSKKELAWLNPLFGFFFKKRQKQLSLSNVLLN